MEVEATLEKDQWKKVLASTCEKVVGHKKTPRQGLDIGKDTKDN